MNKKILITAAALCGFIALSILAISFTPSGNASEAESTWQKRCETVQPEGGESREVCEMFARLTVKETGQTFLDMSLAKMADGQQGLKGRLILPLGINLLEGSAMQIDDGDVLSFKPTYCDVNGCFAFVDLPESVVKGLRKGKALSVAFMSSDRRPMRVDISLDGFSKVLKSL